MAIKGLTPQLAERGKIKIGEKGELKQSQGGKQFAQPKKLDHFVITTMQRDAAGRLLSDTTLMARLNPAGEKLVELPVRLLYDDIDLNFLTRYSAYAGNRCWCSGDGEWAARFEQGEVPDRANPGQCRKAGKGEYGQVPCPCEHLEATFTGQPKCKLLGTLQVLLEGVNRVGGVWKFRTTSWNTVNAILSILALIKTLTGGPLAGIPLMMVLSPKTVTVPTTGQNMVVYVVSLEYRGPEEQLTRLGYDKARERIERQIKMETVEAEARRLLVAPHEEPPTEQQETAEEFYPEAVTAQVVQRGDKSAGAAPQSPSDAKKTPSPAQTPGPGPEATTTAATQGQDTGKRPTMTLPQVMEACKDPKFNPILPVTLTTSKGVAIGQWVDRFFGQDEAHNLVFEMLPNLKDLAQGLTKEDIARSFTPRYQVVFQEPGTERAGDEESLPQGPGLEEATPATVAPPAAGPKNGKRAAALF